MSEPLPLEQDIESFWTGVQQNWELFRDWNPNEPHWPDQANQEQTRIGRVRRAVGRLWSRLTHRTSEEAPAEEPNSWGDWGRALGWNFRRIQQQARYYPIPGALCGLLVITSSMHNALVLGGGMFVGAGTVIFARDSFVDRSVKHWREVAVTYPKSKLPVVLIGMSAYLVTLQFVDIESTSKVRLLCWPVILTFGAGFGHWVVDDPLQRRTVQGTGDATPHSAAD